LGDLIIEEQYLIKITGQVNGKPFAIEITIYD